MTRLTPQMFFPVVALAALLGACSATSDVDETEAAPGLQFRQLHSLSQAERDTTQRNLDSLSGQSMSPGDKARALSSETFDFTWCRSDPPMRERGALFGGAALTDPEDPDLEYVAVPSLVPFSGDDLLPESIQATLDGRGKPAISYAMNPEAASDYADWTGSHIGEPLAIVIGHELLSAPILQGRISGTGLISGDFSSTEIEALVQSLRTAASRAP